MIVSNKTMDLLKGVGLNLYERKLWVALLARGTSNAGELSAIAKVPRSRAYDILESLSEKGFVVVQNSKPIKYVAIEPTEALDRAKARMEENIKSMSDRMDDLKKSSGMKELNSVFGKGMSVVSSEDLTGSLKGKHLHRQQMSTMIKGASKRINIVATAEGMKEIHENHYETLKNASANGVAVRIATVATPGNKSAVEAFKEFANLKHMQSKESSMGGGFCIVDGKEMLMALTDPKNVHDTQHVSFWSKSDHAAGKVFDPMFEMLWKSSKVL